METKLYTFIDIFNTDFDVEGGSVRLQKIIIPIIQRDYAQGRKSSGVTRVRNRFLDALRNALTGEPITLDFVYGDIDTNGVLTPLDGQQRLTTLFLLHWYAAKKEKVAKEEFAFLDNFGYETRYSARDFCHELVRFEPTFTSPTVEEEIVDQPWFPLEWKKDPTISSMLVMIDAIHASFADIPDIWQKLKEGCISFYFLPIRNMGLTDELYIKMNSRGKPLTSFEHFKAELEEQLNKYNKDVAKEIIRKIDIDWTDMLWSYRGDDNVTDDEFLRYFNFICDIICYRNNQSPQGKSHDPFDLLETYFSSQTEHLQENIATLESFFDCWCELGQTETPSAFCERVMSKQHEEGKVKIDNRYAIDIFNDCLRTYGESQSNGNRRFPLGRTVLLYALVEHLIYHTTDFVHRLRIVNNLVMNSEDEISDSTARQGGNRMPAILRQVDSIIKEGKIPEIDEPSFNVNQLQEEREKMTWLQDNADKAEQLYEVEDHPLLYGQIGILGLDHIDYSQRFTSLFCCDWNAVAAAMLAFGDYKQKERNDWRYQLGSSMDSSWKELFHRGGSAGFEGTHDVLIRLLSTNEAFSNEYLQGIAVSYTARCEAEKRYDWKYYFIKYSSFRPGRYGKYNWDDFDEKPYEVNVLVTHYNLSANSYNPFLQEIDAAHINRDDFGRTLLLNDKVVRMTNDALVVSDAATNEEVTRHPVPMNDDGTDSVDRVQYFQTIDL